ncbi:MAG: hypothetical protein ACLQVN_18305 [Bryobacteraceae bacterium]
MLGLALFANSALAAGPAYVRDEGATVALGNDSIERVISLTDGDVGTVALRNKISGREYTLGGSEFEIRLIAERVGYSFGTENPMVLTASRMRVAGHRVEDLPGGGKRLLLQLEARRGGLPAIDLVYEIAPTDFFTRQRLHIAKPEHGTYFIDSIAVASNDWGLARFSLGGYGQPLFTTDLFLGLEYPTGVNRAEGGVVSLVYTVGQDIPEGGYSSESAVIGAAPQSAVHPQFLAYVDRMRAAHVRPYLLYNSWYDLQRLAMNHANTVERVPQFKKLLLDRYGLHLDSFVLDDGWDDMHHLWAIDEQRFPGGFHELAAALSGISSGLGLWFGPIGGYDQRAVRIQTGRREGMDITTNGQYFCIAGDHYRRLLSDTMARYQKQYGVNYFKVDGVSFSCNAENHGHPTGIYADAAVARSLIAVLERLRGQDPKVFLNITTSIWLSPWWLRWADTVWMGGEDSGYLPSVPTMAPRQSAVSYRDSVLYDDFVAHRVQFPISSLMTHGVIKGKYNMLGGDKESLDDWRDEVVHYFSVGNMMYELYISPDILSPAEMDALGNTIRWAEANAHPLLDNSTLVLGDPAAREPYGYVHSSTARSIVTLRNPFVRPRTAKLRIGAEEGFAATDQPMAVEVLYPYRKLERGTVKFGDTLSFDLGAYEQIVVELHPADASEIELEGSRFEVTKAGLRVYFEPPTAVTFTAPAVTVWGAAGVARTVYLEATVELPAGCRESKAAFLLEPMQEITDVKGEALDNGKPVPLALENGGHGTWHWFSTTLAPGTHHLAVTLHIPAAPGEVHLSGWLLARRTLMSREMRGASPPEDTLPADSSIERTTYPLIERTIR